MTLNTHTAAGSALVAFALIAANAIAFAAILFF